MNFVVHELEKIITNLFSLLHVLLGGVKGRG